MKVGLELSSVMVLILFFRGIFFYGDVDSLIFYVRGQEKPPAG